LTKTASGADNNAMGTLKFTFASILLVFLAGAGDIQPSIHGTQGAFIVTASQWNVAIQGSEFFKVLDSHNEYGFTRTGRFYVNGDGELGVAGCRIVPPIRFPAVINGDVQICQDGIVIMNRPATHDTVRLGQIELVTFPDPERLELRGGLYRQTNASGAPVFTSLSPNGPSAIVQQFIKLGDQNVKP
jgi:flagellar basal-body rod protein FlgG